jgi:hypothetical protein
MPISSYPRITLAATKDNKNPQSGTGLAILNQVNGQYVIADSNFFPINNGGLASEGTAALIETNTAQIYANQLINSNYVQGIDKSVSYVLPLAIATLPSQACLQVVLISPINGFWLIVNSGNEIFIPPYTTLPVNVTNTNQLRARYQTAGDTLFYYYH